MRFLIIIFSFKILFATYYSIQLLSSKNKKYAEEFLNQLPTTIKKDSFIYKTDSNYYTVRYLISQNRNYLKKKLKLFSNAYIVKNDIKKISYLINNNKKNSKNIPKKKQSKNKFKSIKKNKILSFGINYSHQVPKEAFKKFDWLVINPDVKIYPTKSKLIGYISIGEQIYPKNKKWIIGKNPLWNSYIMDIRQKSYQDYLIKKLKKMKKFDGFFFDTLDSYFLTKVDKESYKKGLIQFFKRVKKLFPNKILIFNRGYEIIRFIRPTAIVTENLIMLNGKALKKEEQKWLIDKLKLAKKLNIIPIVVEYVNPWDYNKAIKRAQQILNLKFIPYVGDIYLKKVGVSTNDLENNKYIFYTTNKKKYGRYTYEKASIPNWLKMEIALKKYDLPTIEKLLQKKDIAKWQKISAYYKLFRYKQSENEIFYFKNPTYNLYTTYFTLYKNTANLAKIEIDRKNSLFFNTILIKDKFDINLFTINTIYKKLSFSKKYLYIGIDSIPKIFIGFQKEFKSKHFKFIPYIAYNDIDTEHSDLIKKNIHIIKNVLSLKSFYSKNRNTYSLETEYSYHKYKKNFNRYFFQIAFSKMFHQNSFYTIYAKRLIYSRYFTSANEIGGNIFLGELNNPQKKFKFYFNPSLFFNTKSHFGYNIIIGANKRVIKADNLNILFSYSKDLKELKIQYSYYY